MHCCLVPLKYDVPDRDFQKYDTLLDTDTVNVRLAAFAIPNGLTESTSDITRLPIYEKVGYKKVELVRSKI